MTRILRIVTTAAIGLVGCTQFPDLDRTQTVDLSRSEYPALVPIDPILTANNDPIPDLDADNAHLTARLAALRNRAARMRGSVLDGAEKQKLENGLQ